MLATPTAPPSWGQSAFPLHANNLPPQTDLFQRHTPSPINPFILHFGQQQDLEPWSKFDPNKNDNPDLNKLPPMELLVMLCLAHDQMAPETIAEKLHTTPDSIKKVISYIRTTIKGNAGVRATASKPGDYTDLRKIALENSRRLVFVLKQTRGINTAKKIMNELPQQDSRFVDALTPLWTIEPRPEDEQSIPPAVTPREYLILLCLAHDYFTSEDIANVLIQHDLDTTAENIRTRIISLYKHLGLSRDDRNRLKLQEFALQNPRALVFALKQTGGIDTAKKIMELPHPDDRFIVALTPRWTIKPRPEDEQSIPPAVTPRQYLILLCLAYDYFTNEDIANVLKNSGLETTAKSIKIQINHLYDHLGLSRDDRNKLKLQEFALKNPRAIVFKLKQSDYMEVVKTIMALPHPDNRFIQALTPRWTIKPRPEDEQSIPPAVTPRQYLILLCLAYDYFTNEDIANVLKNSGLETTAENIRSRIISLYKHLGLSRDDRNRLKLQEFALKNPRAIVFKLKQTGGIDTAQKIMELPHPDDRFTNVIVPYWHDPITNEAIRPLDNLPPEINFTGLQALILLCLAHDKMTSKQINDIIGIGEDSIKIHISTLRNTLKPIDEGGTTPRKRGDYTYLRRIALENPECVIAHIVEEGRLNTRNYQQAFRIIALLPSPDNRFIDAIKNTNWFINIGLGNNNGDTDLLKIANTFDIQEEAKAKSSIPSITYQEIKDSVATTVSKLRALGITSLKDVGNVGTKLDILIYDETKPAGQRYDLAA